MEPVAELLAKVRLEDVLADGPEARTLMQFRGSSISQIRRRYKEEDGFVSQPADRDRVLRDKSVTRAF